MTHKPIPISAKHYLCNQLSHSWHHLMNCALYDDNAICMLNIIFYSEYLYHCCMYKCTWLYTEWVPWSAELWLFNINSAIEDMLVVITWLFYYAGNTPFSSMLLSNACFSRDNILDFSLRFSVFSFSFCIASWSIWSSTFFNLPKMSW